MTCIDVESQETFRPEEDDASFSKPSAPVISMNLPKVFGFESEFKYNYYVADERVNESPTIPDHLVRKSVEQINTDVVDFSIRIPRYVKLTWDLPSGLIAPTTPLSANDSGISIEANLEKVQTEESFLQSKYSSHSLASFDAIKVANSEITKAPVVNVTDIMDMVGIQTINSAITRGITTLNLNSKTDIFSSTFSGKPRIQTIQQNYKPIRTDNPSLNPGSISELARQNKFQLQGNKKLGLSLSNLVDSFNKDLLSGYSSYDQKNLNKTNKDSYVAVKNIEDIANNNIRFSGISFYDKDNTLIKSKLGYEAIKSTLDKNPINIQLNQFIGVDIFLSSSMLSKNEIKSINKSYLESGKYIGDFDDVYSQPAYIGPIVQNPDSFNSSAGIVGYIIEKHIQTADGYKHEKTFTVESPYVSDFVDTNILFGKIYSYSIRSVLRIVTTGFDEESDEIREIAYFIGSKPVKTVVKTFEYVPPPPPVDLNFVWDYKNSKLQVYWGMPVNSQRDIKQFQVFRRSSIEEPFELISQKCFDYSALKYRTGETIDGNIRTTDQSNLQLIEYSEQPILFHIDDDFVVDTVNLKSPKFIYSIVAIDAHGLSSNYGSQFEVTFDFFKNTLIKKLISTPGAPKPYPNLYVKIDAFKDVIKTNGFNSTKMKVYFVPEYFKIEFLDGRVQRMVSTKQDNAYYKIQFINLQNQKSDSLKITIDDPQELTK
jgi:hypothetical protein